MPRGLPLQVGEHPQQKPWIRGFVGDVGEASKVGLVLHPGDGWSRAGLVVI